MRVRWSTDAANDLEQITERIAEHRPNSALRVARRIYRRLASLAKSPNHGRVGWVEGTRELVLAPLPYVAVYRVAADAIEILHIYHGAQNWRQ
jgi:addiction module RelE/StbE family toxin